MIWSVRFLLVVLVLLSATPLYAVQVDEILPDPGLETRARVISHELRCMVCQNQSIDDSEAPLARDLRLLVRERLKAGDSDTQVVDFMVARYGEFVLLRPRVELAYGNPVGSALDDIDRRPVWNRLLGPASVFRVSAPRSCRTHRRGAAKTERDRAVATGQRLGGRRTDFLIWTNVMAPDLGSTMQIGRQICL
jgi:Cytochrome C biogenesis protein